MSSFPFEELEDPSQDSLGIHKVADKECASCPCFLGAFSWDSISCSKYPGLSVKPEYCKPVDESLIDRVRAILEEDGATPQQVEELLGSAAAA